MAACLALAMGVMVAAEIPLLLSVVCVVQNDSERLRELIARLEGVISPLVSDYEIVIVDNGSTDQTHPLLRRMTSVDGVANLQVYTLAGRVDELTARWVGVENSLGDIVVCIDPRHGDVDQLELLTREAAKGADIVFTSRVYPRGRRRLPRTFLYKAFGAATKLSTGLDLDSYSTSLIAIRRRVVSYLQQFPEPQIKFRNLAACTGFSRSTLSIPLQPDSGTEINLRQSFSRGIQLVTSSSENPLRLATALSAFGAFTSLAYSVYVVLIWVLKKDVAPGWVSLSMQQSGMFFLISLVLLVLSEYVLEISRKANTGPAYYVADEFTSAKLTRKERLNVEVDTGSSPRTRSLFKP
ncbi:MAG: glycosyltransferase [Cyanobacteriota bacterium]|nr:glycosyltransferase [Cyanobacteriota bacterium]